MRVAADHRSTTQERSVAAIPARNVAVINPKFVEVRTLVGTNPAACWNA